MLAGTDPRGVFCTIVYQADEPMLVVNHDFFVQAGGFVITDVQEVVVKDALADTEEHLGEIHIGDAVQFAFPRITLLDSEVKSSFGQRHQGAASEAVMWLRGLAHTCSQNFERYEPDEPCRG